MRKTMLIRFKESKLLNYKYDIDVERCRYFLLLFSDKLLNKEIIHDTIQTRVLIN